MLHGRKGGGKGGKGERMRKGIIGERRVEGKNRMKVSRGGFRVKERGRGW